MYDKMPLVKALKDYINEGTIPFHMPGHKGGRGFSNEFLSWISGMDVTEIPGADNLHNPTGVIRKAQELAAMAFGADHSFFLVNGSSCGIYGMIMATCKPGTKLIVPRNCHKSVWDALVMADVNPVYIHPEYDEDNMLVTQISSNQLESTLRANTDVIGAILLHPSFYGFCSDAIKIGEILKNYNKLLLVDEAHGAHFTFHKDLPPSAAGFGADIWVQSAHKTLPAFTQAAYLHINGDNVSRDEVARNLRIVQSTSPSYVLMASLDWARNYMTIHGQERLDWLIGRVEATRDKLEGMGFDTYMDYGRSEIGYTDKTRLVVDGVSMGYTGYDMEILLRKHGIQVEMSDYHRVVLITSVADDEKSMDKLEQAFEMVAKKPNESKSKPKAIPVMSFSREIPQQVISPRQAFYSIIDYVEIEDSIGRICGGMVGAYPPGIPRFCPGEMIDSQGIEELQYIKKAGGNLFGTNEKGSIPVVRK